MRLVAIVSSSGVLAMPFAPEEFWPNMHPAAIGNFPLWGRRCCVMMAIAGSDDRVHSQVGQNGAVQSQHLVLS